MAFVSLIFAYIIIILFILSFLFLAGLILLVVGIIRKRKPKNSSKKSPLVCIILGSILLIPPVATTLFLAFAIISSMISTNTKRADYEHFTDKWKNEHVDSSPAADEAIASLLSSADHGDRETFAKAFTTNLRNNANFNTQMDAFFDTYPAGLSQCNLDGGFFTGSGSSNFGDCVETGIASYTCSLNGEWYSIYMDFCYANTTNPEEVGVTFLSIENLEANASDIEYNEDTFLACHIKSETEVCARLVDGRGYIFKPTPNRTITETQMREYLKIYKNIADLSLAIGEPNISKEGYDYYYELTPEDGEPRYACIWADSPFGDFLYGYICSDTDYSFANDLISED